EFSMDRLHVGEASPEERQVWEKHLAGCPRCQSRLDERNKQIEEVRELPVFRALLEQGSMVAARSMDTLSLSGSGSSVDAKSSMDSEDLMVGATDLQASLGTSRTEKKLATSAQGGWSRLVRQWQNWTLGGLVLAAAAFAMLHLSQTNRVLLQNKSQFFSPPSKPSHPSQTSQRRAKGSSPIFRVLYFSQGSKHSDWARHGQALAPGDLIQFSVKAPNTFHVMILGLNAKGELSVVIPYPGKESLAVRKGASRLPEHSSLELDDYLGLEAYLFLSSQKPFSFSDVKGFVEEAFHHSGKDLLRLSFQENRIKVQVFFIHKRSQTKRLHPPKSPFLLQGPNPRRTP
ncbi:MAG: hypothetical protein H6728_15555, partial [Myxococcales bacterium]|nr:hypothetical protein [Myxococcales bacterium]